MLQGVYRYHLRFPFPFEEIRYLFSFLMVYELGTPFTRAKDIIPLGC